MMKRFILGGCACLLICSSSACSSCHHELVPIQVGSDSLTLKEERPHPKPAPAIPQGPRTFVIKVPSRPDEPSTTPETPTTPVPAATPPKVHTVPPGVVEDDTLTMRLQNRLRESKINFSDQDPPKIYLSGQTLDEFTRYYESRGYRISHMTVTAGSLLRPVLQEHPELAGKIDITAMDGVTINQVVVEDTGISAADKYIDPNTYQIENKLFVTEMPKNLGARDSQ